MNTLQLPLEQLAEMKNLLMDSLTQDHQVLRLKYRQIAGLEARIGAYLLAMGRPDEAAINLVSQATLLTKADEFEEAIQVYEAVGKLSEGDARLSQYVAEHIQVLRDSLMTRKSQKKVADVVAAVQKLDARILDVADGETERWVKFDVNEVHFQVIVGTSFKILTSLSIQSIVEQEMAEQEDEFDYEEEDEDDEG